MKKNKLSITFFGADNFGILILRELLNNPDFIIKKAVCPFPKMSGRKGELSPTPLETFARENKIDVLNADKELKVKNIDCDFLVVSAFGFKLTPEVLNTPKLAPVCVHPSLLPKFRGASPIQNQILSGDKFGGTSIFLIREKIDSGEILSQEKVEILEKDDYFSLSSKLEKISAKILPETLMSLYKKEITPQKQIAKKSTYCSKISKKDGEINFAKDSSTTIERKFRAFKKWPGIFFFYKNKRVKILDLEVLSAKKKDGICFETFDNKFIEIKKLQMEGKKELDSGEFLRGNKAFF